MTEKKPRQLVRRLNDGLAGLRHGWRRERSLRTQLALLAAGALVLAAAGPPLAWLVAFLVVAAMAVATELVNASLEALLDRLHPAYDDEIGVAKDMSSAAVLLVNVAAAATFVAGLVASFG